MKQVKVLIQLPMALKARIDRLRVQGYTASGYIRHVLEQHFSTKTRKGRHTV